MSTLRIRTLHQFTDIVSCLPDIDFSCIREISNRPALLTTQTHNILSLPVAIKNEIPDADVARMLQSDATKLIRVINVPALDLRFQEVVRVTITTITVPRSPAGSTSCETGQATIQQLVSYNWHVRFYVTLNVDLNRTRVLRGRAHSTMAPFSTSYNRDEINPLCDFYEAIAAADYTGMRLAKPTCRPAMLTYYKQNGKVNTISQKFGPASVTLGDELPSTIISRLQHDNEELFTQAGVARIVNKYMINLRQPYILTYPFNNVFCETFQIDYNSNYINKVEVKLTSSSVRNSNSQIDTEIDYLPFDFKRGLALADEILGTNKANVLTNTLEKTKKSVQFAPFATVDTFLKMESIEDFAPCKLAMDTPMRWMTKLPRVELPTLQAQSVTQATGTASIPPILQENNQAPISTVSTEVDTTTVPLDFINMSMWKYNVEELAHQPKETPDSPLAIPMNKAPHSVLDVTSLGETKNMPAWMRHWASLHGYSNAIVYIIYHFITASTVVNELIIGVSDTKKSSYSIDELQTIEWKAISPSQFTAKIGLSLAAVDINTAIPNRYDFVDTYPVGKLIPTVVLMTRSAIQNSYANDALSINIVKQMCFGPGVFRATTAQLTRSLGELGTSDPKQRMRLTGGISMKTLLNVESGRPSYGVLDGGFVGQGLETPSLISLGQKNNLKDASDFVVNGSNGKYGISTITGLHIDIVYDVNNGGNNGTSVEYCSIEAASESSFQVFPVIPQLGEVNKFCRAVTDPDDPETTRYKIFEQASTMLYGNGNTGRALLLLEASGQTFPIPANAKEGAFKDFGGMLHQDMSPLEAANQTQDKILTACVDHWLKSEWSLTESTFIGEPLLKCQTGWGTISNVVTTTVEEPLPGGENVINRNQRHVSANRTKSNPTFNSIQSVDVVFRRLYKLSHPKHGVRRVVAMTMQNAPTGLLENGERLSYTTPAAITFHAGVCKVPYNNWLERFTLQANYNFLFTFAKDLFDAIVVSAMPTRVTDIRNLSSVTLAMNQSAFRFCSDLPSTIPQTIATSNASTEVPDHYVLELLHRAILEALDITTITPQTLVSFNLSSRVNSSAFATVYYMPYYKEFYVVNDPQSDNDRYRAYPKLVLEDIILSSLTEIPNNLGPVVVTNTARWTDRVVPDADRATHYNGRYMTKVKRHVGSRIVSASVTQATEALMAGAQGVSSLFSAFAQIMAVKYGYAQMNAMQQQEFRNKLALMQQQQTGQQTLQQLRQEFEEKMFNKRLDANGLAAPINQRQRTEGVGYPGDTADPNYDTNLHNFLYTGTFVNSNRQVPPVTFNADGSQNLSDLSPQNSNASTSATSTAPTSIAAPEDTDNPFTSGIASQTNLSGAPKTHTIAVGPSRGNDDGSGMYIKGFTRTLGVGTSPPTTRRTIAIQHNPEPY